MTEFKNTPQEEKLVYDKIRCCVGMKNCVKVFPSGLPSVYYGLMIFSHITGFILMCFGMFTESHRSSDLFNPFSIASICLLSLTSIMLLIQKFGFFQYVNPSPGSVNPNHCLCNLFVESINQSCVAYLLCLLRQYIILNKL